MLLSCTKLVEEFDKSLGPEGRKASASSQGTKAKKEGQTRVRTTVSADRKSRSHGRTLAAAEKPAAAPKRPTRDEAPRDKSNKRRKTGKQDAAELPAVMPGSFVAAGRPGRAKSGAAARILHAGKQVSKTPRAIVADVEEFGAIKTVDGCRLIDGVLHYLTERQDMDGNRHRMWEARQDVIAEHPGAVIEYLESRLRWSK